MRKVILAATLVAAPSIGHADEQALLRRLEALEGKVAHLSAVEAENKQLRAELKKTGARREKVAVNTPAPAPTSIPISAAQPTRPAVSWQGFYGGVNGGYGANTNNRRSDIYDGLNAVPPFTSPPLYRNTNEDVYFAGGLAGLQLGYNEVLSNKIMMGIESDANWTNIYDLNNAYNRSGLVFIPNYSLTTGNTTWIANQQMAIGSGYSQTTLQALGTTRFRLGYTFGSFMPFITGGVAYGLINRRLDQTDAMAIPVASSGLPNNYINYVKNNLSQFRAGWAAGAGFEYMFADNWSAKLEYNYAAIGDVNWTGKTSHAYAMEDISQFGIHQVRFGLNYHVDLSELK